MRLHTVYRVIACGFLSIIASTIAYAVGPYTWDGGGATSNLLLNGNWTDDIGPADAQVRAGGNQSAVNIDSSIIFAGNTRLDPTVIPAGWNSDDATPPAVNPDVNNNNIYNNITFDATAGPFVITGDPAVVTIRLGPTAATTTIRNLINNS